MIINPVLKYKLQKLVDGCDSSINAVWTDGWSYIEVYTNQKPNRDKLDSFITGICELFPLLKNRKVVGWATHRSCQLQPREKCYHVIRQNKTFIS